MKMGDKGGVKKKPVRESGGLDSGFTPSVLIDDGIEVSKDSIVLINEDGREHVGDGVVSSVNPRSGKI